MIKAIIFDMDGVVVDNSAAHKKAFKEFSKKHGLSFSENDWKNNILGRTNKEIMNFLFRRDISNEETKKYGKEKESIYREIYEAYIKPVDGLITLLENLERNGFKIALATAAPEENVRFVLSATGTGKHFKTIVDAGDVKKGKPDPEIFLKSAKALNIKPDNCLVFEDSVNGVKAAKAAGMKCIAITTSFGKKDLKIADSIINSFIGFDLDDIRKF